jgi:hypothetical protein
MYSNSKYLNSPDKANKFSVKKNNAGFDSKKTPASNAAL